MGTITRSLANNITTGGVILPSGINNTSISNVTSLPSGVGGKVLQVVAQEYDTENSITGSTFTDSGLTLNITPSSSSNKVFVQFNLCLSGNDNAYIACKIFRGATEIGSTTNTGTGQECFAGITISNGDNSSYGSQPWTLQFLDSPNTTSSTTYKLQLSPMRTSSNTLYLNRSNNLGDDNQFRTSSGMTLMEIAG